MKRFFAIIEVVMGIKGTVHVIIFTKVADVLRLGHTLIVTGNMIWNKIDNHFKPHLMRTLDKGIKLLHTTIRIVS